MDSIKFWKERHKEKCYRYKEKAGKRMDNVRFRKERRKCRVC